jgi:RNA polymerase sigma factor (sigma-70 family)
MSVISTVASPSVEARNAVLLANMALIDRAAGIWAGARPDAVRALGGFDDVRQLACIFAMRAIESFNPSIAKLSTWIVVQIRLRLSRAAEAAGLIRIPDYHHGEARAELRARLTPLAFADAPLLEEGQELEPAAPEPAIDLDLDAEAVGLAMKGLPRRWRAVLRRRMRGETLEVIAKRLDISRERVRQIQTRAVAKVREELGLK